MATAGQLTSIREVDQAILLDRAGSGAVLKIILEKWALRKNLIDPLVLLGFAENRGFRSVVE